VNLFLAKVMAALASLGAAIHQAPRELDPPMASAVASWYDEDGPGACGYGAQEGLRFASLILTCGTKVWICHTGCVTATMADHGPYVAGRTFDLNANLRAAIGCPDLCTVRWRVVP
jgi:hypothetical protein